MSNPLSNRQISSWMDRTIAKLRDAFESAIAVARRLKPLYLLTMGVLACALLLGGISLLLRAGDSSSKKKETLSATATSETKGKVGPATAQQNRTVAQTQRRHAAKHRKEGRFEEKRAAGGAASSGGAGDGGGAALTRRTDGKWRGRGDREFGHGACACELVLRPARLSQSTHPSGGA
jgi:hypothetical protein